MSQRVKMGVRRRRQAERALAARQALALEMADPESELGRALRAAYGTGFRVAPVPAPSVFADVKSLRARQAACAHEGVASGAMCLRCGAVVLPALPPRPAPRMVVGLDLGAGPDRSVSYSVRCTGLEQVPRAAGGLASLATDLGHHVERMRQRQDERIKAMFSEAKIPKSDDIPPVVSEGQKGGKK